MHRRRSIAIVAVLAVGLAAPAPAAAQVDTCGGLVPTIVGTSGDDRIFGTPGPDVIVTGDGRDVVRARGGDDVVCTGDGGDIVDGGNGDDRIFGGAGDDSLRGRVGDDRVHGGAGDDRLVGGDGDDWLGGNEGDDRIEGGPGADTLLGHQGADALKGNEGADDGRGGTGADVLWGGGGTDSLLGGLDDDIVRGGGHDDTVRGGGGDDRVRGGAGDDLVTGDRGDDRLHGGPGDDYLDGGRGTDRCADDGIDVAVCENSRPPPDTFACVPSGGPAAFIDRLSAVIVSPHPGPRGPLVFIGDSISRGEPQPLVDRLSSIGYGPICLDAVGSRWLHGAPTGYTSGLAAVDRIRTGHPIWSSQATWVVALGTNDMLFPNQPTVGGALGEVTQARDAIGAAVTDLWWVNVGTTRDVWAEREQTWNAGVVAHGDFGIIDWNTHAAGRDDWYFDGLHPNAEGQQQRRDLIASVLG